MKNVLSPLIFSRIIFLFFAIAASYLIPQEVGYIGKQVAPHAPYLAWVWANFDGRHFLRIATEGYKNFDFAFFPLYPFLISVLNLGQPLYAGLAISLLSFLGGLVILRKIVLLDFDKKIADAAVLVVCIFPLSFFYNSVYSDSLFFLVTLTSFYFARRQEWAAAGFFAGLASLARLSGIAILPALAVEWYLQNKGRYPISKMLVPFLKSGLLAIVFGLMGIGGYILGLSFFKGDPFLFQKSMVAWGQSGFVFPLRVVFRYLRIFASVDYHLLIYWIAILEFVTIFTYFGLAIYVWRKVRASYAVFMIILLLLVPFTGTFAGTPRYMLHLFPGFIAIAILMQKNIWLKKAIIVLFLILGSVLTALFTRGYFVS
ncbi:MAG: hypothetical protein HY376_00375 [Candidatus Blackburnbacteria bacterium]|nr:hypothetical protein [Candidatus Blackburnbacteria bacterium]